ncbi:hypothetical protein TREMEDRAFT_67874 [Tremella mesenterica DSM 1558]|uniref:uncharacterized protein n=1 Tax=Tremella mesenterica (strain ATCC 24925 / CBS 8224 / DSM 1558 / NBRC 9311 / NRRL Y-6157 / RJB 2259-6 / UBC 559-6) TaxID=578456 RepID=UPI0003F49CDC|nr:uncharacterized protein TREMEDRAFT_67874 [Tremella mesenterica DSM 1558]EIW71640.1 hypothetical protein TREMEDRAFT_67874 [Tremella mesenterica DSM 1558]
MSILSVHAGRSHRRSSSENWVDPSPEKGSLKLSHIDGLLHFRWTSRTGNRVEDELIIFPGEAEFKKAPQDPTGRTHVLQFLSSDQKYFYWFQGRDKSAFPRAASNIHSIIQDPSFVPEPAPTTAGNVGTSTATSGPVASANDPATSGGTSATQAPTIAAASSSEQQAGDASLNDILNPDSVRKLLNEKPALLSTLIPLLPSGALPSNPTTEDFITAISRPVFVDAIRSLENALRQGGLPGTMMREFGLPAIAGLGVGEFLNALIDLGKSSNGTRDDSMETD